MSRSSLARSLVMSVVLLASTLSFAPGAAAASPRGSTRSVAAPVSMNVRGLVQAVRGPGFVAPIRRAVPVLALPKKSAPARQPARAATQSVVAGPSPRFVVPWDGFGEKVAFGGLADTATVVSPAPILEPPDPWVAVGPNHVVQSVNRTVRMSGRDGSLILQVPLATFFMEPPDQVGDGDPRVLYDAAHGRWVASELSWDCAAGHVRLAISDTGDPTGAWHVWNLQFAGSLPGLPRPGPLRGQDRPVRQPFRDRPHLLHAKRPLLGQ